MSKKFVRAHLTPSIKTQSLSAEISATQDGLQTVAQMMFSLMMRNVATDGFRFADPNSPDPRNPVFSTAGCIVAAPSYKGNTDGVDQDYIYNWTRDAAITAMEIVVANLPTTPGSGVEPLVDYVNFAQTCQTSATAGGHFSRAAYTIDGQMRDWSDQNDGPALQSLAILQAYSQLDQATQAVAKNVVTNNLFYLVAHYQDETTNLWEEEFGLSFFAQSAILRFFQAIKTNTIGIAAPGNIDTIIAWLQNGLQDHWTGTYYQSLLHVTTNLIPGYDPNIDVISACIYGAVPATDTKLLATAALLRSQWDQSGPYEYQVNVTDAAQGMGPMLGRYPGDTYDGDQADQILGSHPWPVCTCNFAQLYYKLANDINASGTVPIDALSAPFFNQVKVSTASSPAEAAAALIAAGDSMLQAVVFHSDHLELSEQYDGTTGFEKSVKNLTWSYAAFLSAVREKTGTPVRG